MSKKKIIPNCSNETKEAIFAKITPTIWSESPISYQISEFCDETYDSNRQIYESYYRCLEIFVNNGVLLYHSQKPKKYHWNRKLNVSDYWRRNVRGLITLISSFIYPTNDISLNWDYSDDADDSITPLPKHIENVLIPILNTTHIGVNDEVKGFIGFYITKHYPLSFQLILSVVELHTPLNIRIRKGERVISLNNDSINSVEFIENGMKLYFEESDIVITSLSQIEIFEYETVTERHQFYSDFYDGITQHMNIETLDDLITVTQNGFELFDF